MNYDRVMEIKYELLKHIRACLQYDLYVAIKTQMNETMANELKRITMRQELMDHIRAYFTEEVEATYTIGNRLRLWTAQEFKDIQWRIVYDYVLSGKELQPPEHIDKYIAFFIGGDGSALD